MSYRPEPIDTGAVALSDDLRELTEVLARNAHDVWARLRFAQGWRWGPERSDARKETPPWSRMRSFPSRKSRQTATP